MNSYKNDVSTIYHPLTNLVSIFKVEWLSKSCHLQSKKHHGIKKASKTNLLIHSFFFPRPYKYSGVHKSPPPFFSKILEKPSIVQKKMMPYINGLLFFSEMKQKRKKIKMTASISSSANFQYFS